MESRAIPLGAAAASVTLCTVTCVALSLLMHWGTAYTIVSGACALALAIVSIGRWNRAVTSHHDD